MLVLGIDLFILHRLPNELDIAPFQIDPLGVQGEWLHRTELAVDENLFSGTNSEMLPSSAQDFTDVTLAGEKSAIGLLGCDSSFGGVRLRVT